MNIFPKLYIKIFDYSLKKITNIKFIDILKTINIKNTNRIELSTKHIYNEMPIRIANRITDLNNLPFKLSTNSSINKIREWYLTSFMELTESKIPNTGNEIINYKNKINNIYIRHSPTLVTISKGLFELKRDNKITDIESPIIQKILNNFHTNRIEIRILLEQYLSLFENTNNNNYFGIINLKSNPQIIINDVITNIKHICDKNNMLINLDEIIDLHYNNKITLPFVDHYLYYILFELIKNSVQAVIDKQKIYNNYNPKININIIDIDNNLILIKIKDNGIGIKENNMEKIWSYSYSSSPINTENIIDDNDFGNLLPLSGFGYGLPISNIYINFFNSSINNIKIDSTYMKGTDVYFFLKKHNIHEL